MTPTLHASELDPDSNSLLRLTESRYLRGRPSTTHNNPRGKHHRRPLPWDRSKLTTAQSYDWHAEEYREWLWEISKQRKSNPSHQQDPDEDSSTDDNPKKQLKTTKTHPKNEKQSKGKKSPKMKNKQSNTNKPPTNGKRNPKQDRTQRKKAKNKILRPATGHFLALVDAHAKRNREIFFRCGCCWDLRHTRSPRWWREYWDGILEQGREEGLDGRIPLPGEFGTGKERGWGFGEGWDEEFEEGGYDEEGVVGGMEEVERRGVEFVLRWRYAGMGVVEEEEAGDEELDTDGWGWEFVGAVEEHGLKSVSDCSEWLAVCDGGDSWQG
ncbi:hypothetical protein QBC34DRAFT_456831 [Podospora aff. communis PSN243]|uniref:Uncharacterized protein n=1 Tax=Podospora aff. communis PSN243 TaxID=3040156 RepID=A0AAV9G077_9PEZI|nr:hypothetical protein QBC34DRAFT_456831 [Podospora aff. communis PSN243]